MRTFVFVVLMAVTLLAAGCGQRRYPAEPEGKLHPSQSY